MSLVASGGSELTAIVLNWRTPELTARSVRALVDDGVPAHRIVVVDNGSGQDNVAWLEASLPGCQILALRENRGFGAANNLAARELPATGAYLFVNSDAFVHRPGSLGRLHAALAEPLAGVAVPRLLNQDLSLQRNVYPRSTLMPEIIRAAGLSRIVPQRLAPQLGAHWDHATAREIQSAIGAVLLVRALAWEQLGGFDEHRFMYAEDLDLFWRLDRLGWRARFVPDAEFVHLGGASSAQRWDDPGRAERVARAEAEMLRAQLGHRRSSVVIGTMATGAGLRALAFRLQGHTTAAASQKAWARGYRARR